MSAPHPSWVRSVRDVHRLCKCDWEPVFDAGRPDGWLLVTPAEACPFHGTGQCIRAIASDARVHFDRDGARDAEGMTRHQGLSEIETWCDEPRSVRAALRVARAVLGEKEGAGQ